MFAECDDPLTVHKLCSMGDVSSIPGWIPTGGESVAKLCHTPGVSVFVDWSSLD